MSNTMLSTAHDDSTSNKSHSIIPLDIDNQPITYSGNPAHVLGCLYEVSLFYERHGYFKALLEDGAVALSNGKLAVDSIQAVNFIQGINPDPVAYGFDEPCPPTAKRIQRFDDAARAASTPAFKLITAMPDPFKADYIVSKHHIAKEDAALLASLSNIFVDSDEAASFIQDAKGSGRTLIRLLLDHASKAKPTDKALVTSALNTFTSDCCRAGSVVPTFTATLASAEPELTTECETGTNP